MTQPSPPASTSAKATADRSAGQASRAGLAVLAALVLLAGATQLARAGYSPDEEFTVFAVNGIAADGLPILPSGLLYDRGLAYSYTSWLARGVSGSQLPAYRALSLLSAVATLAIVFALVRRLSSTPAALVASVLVATSIPLWAAATTARFYSPFLLSYFSALLALCTFGTESTVRTFGTVRTVRTLGALVVLAAISRWLHELAFTLPLIPLACAMLDSGSQRRRWLKAAATVVVGLLGAQAVLFAFHYLAPSSGETMIRRFFLWQVINLFEVPPDRQYGLILAVMVIAWLVTPRRVWLTTVIGLSGVSLVLAYGISRASNLAPISRELVTAVLTEGARYPLDMFWHVARMNPVTLAVALGLLVARLAGAGGEWRPAERAAHLLWIGWVLWFGVVESGITINYLLVPVSFMLVAITVDVVAVATGSDPAQAFPRRGLHSTTQSPRGGGPGLTPTLVVTLVVVAVIADQWRGEGSPAARLAAARPTITAPGLDEIRDGLRPTDRIVCTDELGCLMLVNRIDVWLALDDYVRERFLVRKGDDAMVGVYTGVPAVLRPADLFSPGRDGTLPERTLIVDIFKEHPIGSSRNWLPRAIEADGLEVRPLLETPQLRVLQVSPPISNAARQP